MRSAINVDAIAKLLYEEANQEELKTLAGIEKSVRNLALEYVMPQIGFFYQSSHRHSNRTRATDKEYIGRTAADK